MLRFGRPVLTKRVIAGIVAAGGVLTGAFVATAASVNNDGSAAAGLATSVERAYRAATGADASSTCAASGDRFLCSVAGPDGSQIAQFRVTVGNDGSWSSDSVTDSTSG